jgi:hypothetical protein
MTANPSAHTILINEVIGFCKVVGKWPGPLKEAGYQLESISSWIENRNSGRVDADVLVKSMRENYVLFIECKSGDASSIEHIKDQIDRFRDLEPENVKPHVKVVSPEILAFEYVFACESEGWENLNKFGFPILEIDNKITKHNSFINGRLDSKFQDPIPINDYPPLNFYKFGPYDSNEYIALEVFQEIMARIIKKRGGQPTIEAEDILRGIFQGSWSSITEKHKKDLKAKVNIIIANTMKSPYLSDFNQSNGPKSWTITKLEEFKIGCQEVIKKLSEQEIMDSYA